MEEFKGLCRNARRSKIPPNMWEFAKNILLKKGGGSIANEEGFDYKHNIPGKELGRIETNEEIVYFSFDGTFSYIGYYKTNIEPAVYVPVLKSIYLGFKYNRPIEGVFFYNFKKELIVGFCDGVFVDSNTPKLINLTNIGIALTPALELVNPSDLGQLNLFPNSIEGNIDIDYEVGGTLDVDVVYVTFAYVLADGQSSTSFFPIHTIAYPTHNFDKLDKRNVIINLSDLDTTFTKLRIGLLAINSGGIKGYQSDIKNFSGTTYSFILSSLTNFTEITTDELVVGNEVYSRLKTMTVNNDELIVANGVKTGSLPFQKFANNLKLGLYYDIRPENKFTHPILCPDEVYSVYISLELLDGTYTQEYHIAGEPEDVALNETTVLSTADINALGLDYLNTIDTYKKFRIVNTGGFKINTVPVNLNNPAELELRWGYWENQEQYPNNPEYDGTVDYNGNPIVGGEDLRNKNIRYHRVPGLDALVDKFPCVLGNTNKNQPTNNTPAYFAGLVPSFSIDVLNFDAIVTPDIKSQIQGYRLSIVKRKTGERLVEDINFLRQAMVVEQNSEGGIMDFDTTVGYEPDQEGNRFRYAAAQFGYSRVRSNLLSTYKPNITPLLAKANYAYQDNIFGLSPDDAGFVDKDITVANANGTIGVCAKIPNTQRYAVIKDIEYILGNNTNVNTFLVEEHIRLTAHNTLQPAGITGSLPQIPTRWNPLLLSGTNSVGDICSLVLDRWNVNTKLYAPYQYNTTGTASSNDLCYSQGVCATFINLPKNVYTGFKPTEFITIGKCKTQVGNSSSYRKLFKLFGDVFTNNGYSIPVCTSLGTAVTGIMRYNQLVLLGGFSVTNNDKIYITKDRKYGKNYELNGGSSTIADLLPLQYQLQIFNKEELRSLNDIIVGVAFSINNPFIDYFPYRVHRSLKIGNETIETNNIRRFLSNNYKEMLNDRGEVTAVRGSNKVLYIAQKYSLFVASIKDRLNTDTATTFLGEGDIFDRKPDEIMYSSNRGYIGCTSQFSCKVFKIGLVITDQVKGKIFIIGQDVKEISKAYMDIWFAENWETTGYYTLDRFGNKQIVDNPFTQVGHCLGYDEKYNRLLFTKKHYKFNYENQIGINYTFDGEYYYDNNSVVLDFNDTNYFTEISYTFSYSIDNDTWVCEHDYFPNDYFYTNRGLYAISNATGSKVYKTNSKLSKGYFFDRRFKSFVDLVFNTRLDLSKLYQNVSWNTQVIGDNNENLYFKTIDFIALYTDYQCTGDIALPFNTFSLSRNAENIWEFNNFRDVVVNSSLPIVDSKGVFQINNLNNNRSWFDKSNFIHTFIIVRMGMNNQSNNSVYIHQVGVKSRMSDRT